MIEIIQNNFGSQGFTGENLIPGYVGKFLIVLMFFMSILSTVSYFFSIYTKDEQEKTAWLKLGRISFFVHGAAILGIFSTLFYIIFNHKFEYYYAWRHSNLAMPLKYIISCFWEGQEGSFLLWMLWHFILGVIMMFTAKAWEKYTMSTLSFVQVILGSMLLGIYLFGKKIGINPFELLRDEMNNAPIFQKPDYLSFIKDGNGLNVLLQNYWMTIHPPILFLGFASTTFPFAYAIAALFKKDYTSWVSKALPWSVFSLSVLGTGIIMGGAWAYESLSFGGFWAWDPVENASLVPWIIGVAALHTLLVYKNTKNGLQLSYVFNILCFVLIIYSTFLTRSGVLGESSVHSFTDEGLGWQLVVMLVVFTVPSFVWYAYHAIVKMPKNNTDEEVNTREFWMFVGALVLTVSAFFITKTTSIELWNKIFDTKYSQPVDIKFHHNKIQLLFGITVAIFTAITQYLGYKRSNYKGLNWMWGSLGIAVILTIALVFVYELFPDAKQHPNFASYYLSIGNILLLCAGLFSIFANAAYLFQFQKKQLLQSGGSVAHIGFALMLVGIVISQYKQEVISTNLSNMAISQLDEKTKNENSLMYKGMSVAMNDYIVTYKSKYQLNDKTFFKVTYEKWDEKDVSVINKKNIAHPIDFELEPFMQRNGKSGDLVSNPSTKHFWNKDIFTNVTSFNADEGKESAAQFDTLSIHDTFFTSNVYVVLDSLVGNPPIDSIQYTNSLFGIGAYFTIKDMNGGTYTAIPTYLIDVAHGNIVKSNPFNNSDAGVKIQIENIMPDQRKILITYAEIKKPNEFIIMRAIVFPQINLVWLGAIIMVAGGLISTLKRYLENKRLNL